jgi:hypothetical protein
MPRVHIKEKKRKRGTTAAAAPKDFTVREIELDHPELI